MTWFGKIFRGRRGGNKQQVARIGIVGGGFSGTLVLVNLVDLAAPGTIVELFEVRGDAGPGTAYGTRETTHLLNVPAGRMGALAAQPDGFYRWLQTGACLACRAQLWPRRDVQATDYVPRALYAAYLKDLLADTLVKASRAGIDVRIVRATVLDVSLRGNAVCVVTQEDGRKQRSNFDALVLAAGNFPPRRPAFVDERALRSPRYVGDVWHPPASGVFPHGVDALPGAKTILILGTGLTAVDAILTLQAHGFKGKTIAISRHGRLPAAHSAERRGDWKWIVAPDRVQPTASALLRWLKQEARRAAANGVDWRSILDTLRPLTQTLWRKLSTEERCKVLRKHSLWSIHRHRMAPEIHAKIEALQREGKLEVAAARIFSVRRRHGGFRVRLRRRGTAKSEVIRPSFILNCTGPEYDVATIDDRLLLNLLRKKLIVRSPVGAGISIGADGSAEGGGNGCIFAIGPLLVGELFECTAVPELREIALRVAEHVAASLPNPPRDSKSTGLRTDQSPPSP
ncbi:MAG: FAD/NAD(P)-binding protein [Rhizomicrobium sp.]